MKNKKKQICLGEYTFFWDDTDHGGRLAHATDEILDGVLIFSRSDVDVYVGRSIRDNAPVCFGFFLSRQNERCRAEAAASRVLRAANVIRLMVHDRAVSRDFDATGSG